MDVATASDETLLAGIREMAIEEGYYWTSNSSHSFGVAKSTDDHFQCFLRETLPDHHFISGQFLSGIESKTMQANADLFEIAKKVRANEELAYVVIVTPARFLMPALEQRDDAREVLADIRAYLAAYGHQGYSMDFVEPTQVEDPSALFAPLKAMVQDPDYDPKQQEERAAHVRAEKHAEIRELLHGLEYWQFRYRWWLARRYNYIREEVAFHFGYTWSVLRPMAAEIGRRMVEVGGRCAAERRELPPCLGSATAPCGFDTARRSRSTATPGPWSCTTPPSRLEEQSPTQASSTPKANIFPTLGGLVTANGRPAW